MKTSPKQYAQTLYDLTDGQFKPQVEKAVSDFAAYLHKERKLKLADRIIEQFENIYNKEKRIAKAEIATARKLENRQAQKVKKYVEKKYHAKEVILKNTVDENIKGGFVLRIGDVVMDGSVRRKLNELKKVLTS